MKEEKRDLFASQTSTKEGNLNQDDMARSSGDNDADRVVSHNNEALKKAGDEYFEGPQKSDDDRSSEDPTNRK